MSVTSLQRTAPDISCEHCVKAISEAVGALDGVSRVQVDIDSKRVDVDFDADHVSEKEIDAAMEEEGYPVA